MTDYRGMYHYPPTSYGERRGFESGEQEPVFDAGVETRRRRSYAGLGPKTWRRSDEQIREDLSERLALDPEIDASEMSVDVKDGEVILSGWVRDRDSRQAVEEMAERIPGVRNVQVQLRVARNGVE